MAFSRRLVPSYARDNLWDDIFQMPRRIADQNFGMGLFEDDFITPSLMRNYYFTPRRLHVVRHGGTSQIKNDDKKFVISLDVNHFKPEEITVKTVDNSVVIHGKHEEKEDEHGYISREFTRRYELPKEVLPETITSALTPDGFLLVEAPKKALEQLKPNERVVPISIKEKDPAIKEKEEKMEESK